jgi:hypothetical protein
MKRGTLTRQKPYRVRPSGGGGGAMVQLAVIAGFKPGDDVHEYLTKDGLLIVRAKPSDNTAEVVK